MAAETKLAQAARHVATGRRVVAQQHALIARLEAAGRDTFLSKSLLDSFLRSLANFEDDLRIFQDREASKKLAN